MIFLRETTEVPTQKLKIVTKISKWDNYECVDIGNIKYIRGFTFDNAIDMYSFKLIEQPLILYNLMELYNKLPAKIFSLNQPYVNENIKTKDIDLILAFCKKNGLPFWNRNTNVDVFRNEEDIPTKEASIEHHTLLYGIAPLSKENYFPICSFIVGLLQLHNDFLRVISANNWEEDENIHILLSDNDISKIKDIRKTQAHSKTIDLYTPALCPYTTFWNDEAMTLQLNCNNLMHLSTYHLCTLQQAQDYTGGYMKVCKKCKQLFVAKTPQQKFCNSPCTRQAYYSANKKKGSD